MWFSVLAYVCLSPALQCGCIRWFLSGLPCLGLVVAFSVFSTYVFNPRDLIFTTAVVVIERSSATVVVYCTGTIFKCRLVYTIIYVTQNFRSNNKQHTAKGDSKKTHVIFPNNH